MKKILNSYKYINEWILIVCFKVERGYILWQECLRQNGKPDDTGDRKVLYEDFKYNQQKWLHPSWR